MKWYKCGTENNACNIDKCSATLPAAHGVPSNVHAHGLNNLGFLDVIYPYFHILFDYVMGGMKSFCLFGGFFPHCYSETEALDRFKESCNPEFVLLDSSVQERIRLYNNISNTFHLYTINNSNNVSEVLFISVISFYIRTDTYIINHFWGLQNHPFLIWENTDGGACGLNRLLTRKGHTLE